MLKKMEDSSFKFCSFNCATCNRALQRIICLFSIQQCRALRQQCSVYLVDSLTVVFVFFCRNRFARIQKAEMDKADYRPPNSNIDILLGEFDFGKCLTDVQPIRLTSLGCRVMICSRNGSLLLRRKRTSKRHFSFNLCGTHLSIELNGDRKRCGMVESPDASTSCFGLWIPN